MCNKKNQRNTSFNANTSYNSTKDLINNLKCLKEKTT